MDGEAGKRAELRWATDRAIRVAFGETASTEVHAHVRALTEALERSPIPGVLSAQPSHVSVLIVVDPLAATPEAFERRIHGVVAGLRVDDLRPTRLVEIPVLYGGEHGPDLDDVARITGLSPEEVVGLHASAEYTVAFLGFVPGFAYLSGLPEALRLPRLPSPRRRVAPGSVGVAGGQTAVYPLATPGGWRLIGRTNRTLFRPEREPPAVLAVGDRVRFVRVDAVAFARVRRENGG